MKWQRRVGHWMRAHKKTRRCVLLLCTPLLIAIYGAYLLGAARDLAWELYEEWRDDFWG